MRAGYSSRHTPQEPCQDSICIGLTSSRQNPIFNTMFKIPDSRLSASNSAVLASENFLVPITIRSVARSSQAAFEGLQQAYEEVKEFGPALAKTVPGVSLIGFEALLSPRLSRVEVLLRGKEYQF